MKKKFFSFILIFAVVLSISIVPVSASSMDVLGDLVTDYVFDPVLGGLVDSSGDYVGRRIGDIAKSGTNTLYQVCSSINDSTIYIAQGAEGIVYKATEAFRDWLPSKADSLLVNPGFTSDNLLNVSGSGRYFCKPHFVLRSGTTPNGFYPRAQIGQSYVYYGTPAVISNKNYSVSLSSDVVSLNNPNNGYCSYISVYMHFPYSGNWKNADTHQIQSSTGLVWDTALFSASFDDVSSGFGRNVSVKVNSSDSVISIYSPLCYMDDIPDIVPVSSIPGAPVNYPYSYRYNNNYYGFDDNGNGTGYTVNDDGDLDLGVSFDGNDYHFTVFDPDIVFGGSTDPSDPGSGGGGCDCPDYTEPLQGISNWLETINNNILGLDFDIEVPEMNLPEQSPVTDIINNSTNNYNTLTEDLPFESAALEERFDADFLEQTQQHEVTLKGYPAFLKANVDYFTHEFDSGIYGHLIAFAVTAWVGALFCLAIRRL